MRRDWRLFLRHRRELQYQTVEIDPAVVDRAADLIFRSSVRAYDAIQIASAVQLRTLLDPAFELRFVTADQNQATVATTEGLDVDFIP